MRIPPEPHGSSGKLTVLGLILVGAVFVALYIWSGKTGSSVPPPPDQSSSATFTSSPQAPALKFSIRRVDGLIAQDYAFATKPGDEKLVQVMVDADVDRDVAVPVDHCIAELQTGEASQVYQQAPDPRAAAVPPDSRSFGPYWFFIARTDYSRQAQLRLRCDSVVTGWAPFQMANLIEKAVAP